MSSSRKASQHSSVSEDGVVAAFSVEGGETTSSGEINIWESEGPNSQSQYGPPIHLCPRLQDPILNPYFSCWYPPRLELEFLLELSQLYRLWFGLELSSCWKILYQGSLWNVYTHLGKVSLITELLWSFSIFWDVLSGIILLCSLLFSLVILSMNSGTANQHHHFPCFFKLSKSFI